MLGWLYKLAERISGSCLPIIVIAAGSAGDAEPLLRTAARALAKARFGSDAWPFVLACRARIDLRDLLADVRPGRVYAYTGHPAQIPTRDDIKAVVLTDTLSPDQQAFWQIYDGSAIYLPKQASVLNAFFGLSL